MPLRASQWAPKRELQNAKFESYKLSFDDDDEEEERKLRIKFARDGALPGRMLAAGPASELRLGYKEARNRAKWNHLAAGTNGAVAWIDGEGVFWLAELSQNIEEPINICTLPQPIGQASASSSSFPAEYPVARHLKGSIWAASDGAGRLYIVDAERKAIQASHDFVSDTGSLIPFRLHCARLHEDTAIAVVSSSVVPSGNSSAPARISEKAKEFQIDVLRIPLASSQTDSTPLQSTLSLRGTDLPLHVAFVGERCCLGSSSQYRLASGAALAVDSDAPANSESSEYETVGVPRTGEGATVIAASTDTRPPPYSWNQQSDSVTVVFPLPPTISAKDIKIVFRPNIVSMVVSSDKAKEQELPKLLSAKLWGDIDAGISTWTWEKVGGAQGKYGLLSLHLEKKHEDTRWPHVFKQDDNAELEKRYLNVEETLDRTELAKITEALEKFTQEAANGGMTAMQQRSSLLGDEMDEEVDMSEIHKGRGVQFTWIEDIGGSPSLSTLQPEMTEVVSLPLPQAYGDAQEQDSTIAIKHDVDGLLFSPPSERSELAWAHMSTFPALAFVLASKRDVVQVYHSSDKLCVALESGSPVGSQNTNASSSYSSMQTAKMNAYLYYPPSPGSKAKTAKQKVISLADPSAGAILGAASIRREKSLDIAVLCERELVVIRDAVTL